MMCPHDSFKLFKSFVMTPSGEVVNLVIHICKHCGMPEVSEYRDGVNGTHYAEPMGEPEPCSPPPAEGAKENA